jgi:iron(III) transport system substrate-binding protein
MQHSRYRLVPRLLTTVIHSISGMVPALLFFALFATTLCSPALADNNTLSVVAAYGDKEAIFAEFTRKTGIKIEFIDMSSGEVLARTEAEGGRPMADLWFGGGADSFIKAASKGLLEAYNSPEAAKVPAKYKDKDGYWTGISLVMAGFLVNTEILSEKHLPVPHTWAELAKPEYKGEVLTADPSISGTTYAVVAGLLQKMGPKEGWHYFEQISDNVPFFAKRGGEPPKKAAAGEVAVGVTPLSGEFIHMQNKFPVSPVFPRDGVPWVPAGMAIFKNAKKLDAAQAFVDWALSVEGQRFIQSRDPRIMVRPEVTPPEEFKGFVMSDLLDVDFSTFGTQRKEILDTWAKRVASRH